MVDIKVALLVSGDFQTKIDNLGELKQQTLIVFTLETPRSVRSKYWQGQGSRILVDTSWD